MPRVKAGIVELEYEEFGHPTDPALVLVMGLGAQLIDWPEEFCRRLAERGLRVIRYDNRDSGLSTALDELPVLGSPLGGQQPVPYTLSDLAADTVGLLDGLAIQRAHVVGASMGGMIVQLLALEHPERLLSVTSIMSTTGDPSVGQGTPEAIAALTTPLPADRAEAIEHLVRLLRLTGSAEVTEADLRARATAGYDRARQPAGMARQLAAIVTAGDRTAALRSVDLPALVVHGEADPLLNISGGQATARAIPGAELLTVPGMGHDLPPSSWGTIIEAIVRTAARS
ncbi:MAG TPA: alpha/beta hydrolase [Pseudonocardia sp.]|nr:alpha/beta hydrolase [Pseudonocardia sp.]